MKNKIPPSYSKKLNRLLFFRHIILLVSFCFVVSSCVEDPKLTSELSKLPKESIIRSFTSIQKDEFLRHYKNEIPSPSIGNREGKSKSDFLERANWSRAFKYEDQVKDEITYTIPLISFGSKEFGNLVIVKNATITNSYVINYIPEKKWLDTKKRRQGFGNFSGIIQLISLDGEVFSETHYNKGKVLSIQEKNSRIALCRTEIVVTGYTTICWENQCIISEVRFAEVEKCDTKSSGGGGGTGSGGDTSGGSVGGSTNPDLGTPGTLDPEDIAYWLTTLFEGDDLNNPYHGMKAIAADGTVYTYDGQINGWLMPDVTVLQENGFTPIFFLNPVPDFDGSLVSTLTTAAVLEPTIIGEVVLGGTLFSLWIYSIYEMSTVSYSDAEFELCTYFNARCFVPKCINCCQDCLQICVRDKGAWPLDKCPYN
jgi:hypothetical protein